MDGEWYSKKSGPIKQPGGIASKTYLNNISFVKLNITQSQQKTIHNNYITKGLIKKSRKLYKNLLHPQNTFLIFYYPKKEYGNYFGCYGIYKLVKVHINKNFKEFNNYTFPKRAKHKTINRKLTKEIKIPKEIAENWVKIIATQTLDFLEILNDNHNPKFLQENQRLIKIMKNLKNKNAEFNQEHFVNFLLKQDEEIEQI